MAKPVGNIPLAGWQRKILLLCWSAYAVAYVGRTNLSIALPEMMKDLNWVKTNVGLLGTSFFWAYAIGQLINGTIGDKVNSRMFIWGGLLASSVANLAIGFSTRFPVIVLLWAINGFCLAALWGPIMKTLSLWFSPGERSKVAVNVSTSMIAGYFLAWGLVGQVIDRSSWRWAFFAPAGIIFAYSLVWVWLIRDHPAEVGLGLPGPEGVRLVGSKGRGSLLSLIWASKLWLIAVATLANGIVKEGIAFWGPTFLADTQHLSQRVLSLFSLAIPFMSLLGIFAAGWLNWMCRWQEKDAVIILLSGAALSCLTLFVVIQVNVYAATFFLSLGSALMYGANTLLLGVIPLSFSEHGRVSGVAGFLDFCSYMGAALGGVLTGFIIDHFGYGKMVLFWMVISLLGVIGILGAKPTQSSGVLES